MSLQNPQSGARDGGAILPLTREELLARLLQDARRLGISCDDPGDIAKTLLTLYSHMLSDTVRRINRSPQKHRYAFLNLTGISHLPAHPGETVAVFEPVKGYDQPVDVPKGTMLAAEPDASQEDAQEGEPIFFRVKSHLTVYPCQLSCILWASRKLDEAAVVGEAIGGVFTLPPFQPFVPQPQRGQHTLDFFFSQRLVGADGLLDAFFTASLTRSSTPAPLNELTEGVRWALRNPQAEEAAVYTQSLPDGRLRFYTQSPLENADCLRLEPQSAKLTGLTFYEPRLCCERSGLPLQVAVRADRMLDPAFFYPFENPMRSFEECFLFCDEAFLHPGVQVTLSCTVTLVQAEFYPDPVQETVVYKWIMRKPAPRPEPEPKEAFAQEVRWEYWNGKAFCALSDCLGRDISLQKPGEITLSFVRPEDMAEVTVGEYSGLGLRLSCGECAALYSLPRRIYTPRIENLHFSYQQHLPLTPRQIIAQNFGGEHAFDAAVAFTPFCAPPCAGDAVFIGLDSLPSNGCLNIFFSMGNTASESGALQCGLVSQETHPLAIDDGTHGFSRSGIISVVLPAVSKPCELFGRECFWLRLDVDSCPCAPTIQGVYLNAQKASNRVRSRKWFSISQIGLDGTLRLDCKNLIQVWVFVRSPHTGELVQWQPAKQSALQLKEGFFSVDFHTGVLTFPKEVFSWIGTGQQDTLGIVYDVTGGAQGNIQIGALCRLVEEIPFIQAVHNPQPVVNGWDSESGQRLASRIEHRLFAAGRAVSVRDYELFALDYCPLVRKVKCARRPRAKGADPQNANIVELALLLEEKSRIAFAQIRALLLHHLIRQGCTEIAGAKIRIVEADRVPINCCVTVIGNPSQTRSGLVEKVQQKLSAYLDPVTGGHGAKGWEIGALPTPQQLKAYLELSLSGLEITSLTLSAFMDGRWRDLQDAPPDPENPFVVPGVLTVQVNIPAS